MKRPGKHCKLNQWQIAMIEKAIRNELARLADNDATPYQISLQSLVTVFDGCTNVVVSK